MAAPSASRSGFVPAEPPQVSVASDGTLAAIHEGARVTILALPSGAAFAQIGVDPDAAASEIAWVGSPGRLVVLARYETHSTVHLLDPRGPRTIAEIRLEQPMRLAASVGSTALVVGSLGAAVLAATETHLTLYPFPTRAVPQAAGAAATQIMVALPGTIEEWDPRSRLPKRRLRLPRVAAITAVGGSERLVWMTTREEPARVDVIPLINRGQPRAHDLPEPIARVAGHPRSDLLVCVGAESGQLYVIDLDGRVPGYVTAAEGIDRIEAAALVIGRSASVLVAQARRPIAIVALSRRDPASAPSAADSTDSSSGDGDAGPMASDAGDEPPASSPDQLPAGAGDEPPADASEEPTRSLSLHEPAATAVRSLSLSDVSAAEPARSAHVVPAHDDPAAAVTISPERDEARASWRDAVVAWTRAGALPREAPVVPAIEALAARFEVAPRLQPALTLLYGAHLCGDRGVAPADVAQVLDHEWDEALGRGELAHHALAVYATSRVALALAALRMLDELPPITGTLVGAPGAVALLGACVVVAGDEPLATIAARCLDRVGGAVLAAHAEADPTALAFEARVYGAAPMRRATAVDRTSREPMIVVVADAALADDLGVPRLA